MREGLSPRTHSLEGLSLRVDAKRGSEPTCSEFHYCTAFVCERVMSREISFAKRRRRSAVAVSPPGLVPPAASRAAREGAGFFYDFGGCNHDAPGAQGLEEALQFGTPRLVWCFGQGIAMDTVQVEAAAIIRMLQLSGASFSSFQKAARAEEAGRRRVPASRCCAVGRALGCAGAPPTAEGREVRTVGSWQSVPVETSAYACSTKHTIRQAKHDRERGRMCTRVRHN